MNSQKLNMTEDSHDWIDNCRNAVLSSAEWRSISTHIHDILCTRLRRDGVGFFADLSSQEQYAYIKQIKRYDLLHTAKYAKFVQKLDNIITKTIAKKIDDMYDETAVQTTSNINPNSVRKEIQHESRLESVLNVTAEACAKLLKDFSAHEIQLQLSGLVNISLSPNLRKQIWTLLLLKNNSNSASDSTTNTTSMEFENMKNNEMKDNSSSKTLINSSSSTTINNFRITEECENILLKLSEIIKIPNKYSLHALSANISKISTNNNLHNMLPIMKNILIKYHLQMNLISKCDQRIFYFSIPIIICLTDFLYEPLKNKIKHFSDFEDQGLLLLKQWMTFNINMNKNEIENENKTENGKNIALNITDIHFGGELYLKYYEKFEQLLIENGGKTFENIENIAICSQLRSTSNTDEQTVENNVQSKSVSPENSSQQLTSDSSNGSSLNWIRMICEPIIEEMMKYLFVNIVNIETCLHVWDQLLLSNFDRLPVIICSLLCSISSKIGQCETIDGFTTICKRFLPTIHYSEMMKNIQHLLKQKKQKCSIIDDMQVIRNSNTNINDDNLMIESEDNEQKVIYDENISETLDISVVAGSESHATSNSIVFNEHKNYGKSKILSRMRTKLWIAMIFAAKLHKIRSRKVIELETEMKIETQKNAAENIKILSDFNLEVENDVNASHDTTDSIENITVIDKSIDIKTVTALVLEESISQILQGFQDISMLVTE